MLHLIPSHFNCIFTTLKAHLLKVVLFVLIGHSVKLQDSNQESLANSLLYYTMLMFILEFYLHNLHFSVNLIVTSLIDLKGA